jgi:chromosome segregation ATPase
MGCAMSGTKRSEKTNVSAEELHQELGALTKQIDNTVYALDAVVAAGDTGLKEAYDNYTSEFKGLESQTKAVMKNADHLRKNLKTYVASWKEQLTEVQNPEIREHAEKRLAAAEEQMSGAQDELKRLGENYQTFLETLREVNIVLENDLNPAGVKSIASIVSTVKRDSKPIVIDIDTVMQALAGISQALDTGAPAPPAEEKSKS